MTIQQIVKKYESDLRNDNYDAIFNDCKGEDRKLLIEFLYNTCGIDILSHMSTIPDRMFERASIKKIHIPATITSLGNYCFLSCPVEEVYMDDSVTKLGVGTFMDCSKLNKIRLSRSINELPSESFSGCISLNKIFIPDSVTYFGSNAFSNCSNDLLIVANFRRDPNNKFKTSKNEQDFYKNHLKFKRS